MIFPESRLSLDKIAYFFEGEWENQVSHEPYTTPMRNAWGEWTKYWDDQGVFCYYDKGPGYIVINDNRPRISNAPLVTRRVQLKGWVSEIYLFCDENHSFKAIADMIKKNFRDAPDEDPKIRRTSWISWFFRV